MHLHLLGVDHGPKEGGEDDLASRDLQRRQVVQVVFETPRRLKERPSKATYSIAVSEGGGGGWGGVTNEINVCFCRGLPCRPTAEKVDGR